MKMHNKSHKNSKNANSVAMDSLLIDLQNGYDGEMLKDCFTPSLVHALLNMVNGKSTLNELQK